MVPFIIEKSLCDKKIKAAVESSRKHPFYTHPIRKTNIFQPYTEVVWNTCSVEFCLRVYFYFSYTKTGRLGVTVGSRYCACTVQHDSIATHSTYGDCICIFSIAPLTCSRQPTQYLGRYVGGSTKFLKLPTCSTEWLQYDFRVIVQLNPRNREKRSKIVTFNIEIHSWNWSVIHSHQTHILSGKKKCFSVFLSCVHSSS